MNYRHAYHAGNFADVVKHIVLLIVLRALKSKDTPLCYLDTHAGIGLYALQSAQALKTTEYQSGIAKLMSAATMPMPEIIRDYMTLVKRYNTGELRYYPGSPLIAQSYLRAQDQMILCELHPEDAQSLKTNMCFDKRVAIHHIDAYSGMKAFIPPSLKRGLVLIDPAFEQTDEFEKIARSLQLSMKHWRSGHYVVWYPIKNPTQVDNFYRAIRQLNTEFFSLQFTLNKKSDSGKLSACGMLFINPPWKVKELLQNTVLPYLATVLDAKWKIK